ncbi:MAG TPA: alanine--glyoxylate aminotransferase family protein [Clostridia bacterium]|nr:alanine--glyoxylate aminotransferase family protein [Clostridia bacterium]
MSRELYVAIPGPTPVVRSIQDEMGREIQAFGDPRFVKDYLELIEGLGGIVNSCGQTFALAGTGTIAMEMAVANTAKRGDNALLISHGFFGDRFVGICSRKGINTDVLRAPWGEIVPVDEIDKKLSEKQYAIITVSHVDTSTGVLSPLKELGEMLKKHPETLFIVDGVAATGGEFTDFDAMGIDVLFTASQKAFGVCPGMFMLFASQRALERRNELCTIPEYYVDFLNWLPVMKDPSKFFSTPSINLVWALKESMRLIKTEGMDLRHKRHFKNGRAMQKAFEALGFKVLANPLNRAVTLSNLVYPEGLEDAKFRNALMDEGIIVASGIGEYFGKMCRIGHMGNVTENDMLTILGALERALNLCGILVPYGTGLGVYQSEMAK